MTISINSEYFGMTFWFDVNNDLMYAPSLIDGGYDKDCAGYVSEWDDWEGVDYNKLFDIIGQLVTKKELSILEDNNIKSVKSACYEDFGFKLPQLHDKQVKEKTYQECIDDGWEMTGDGFWFKDSE
tara:strand:+ start:798 stop:1175 length:378 start_codon:yes stop_codon:yes gene_type:complete